LRFVGKIDGLPTEKLKKEGGISKKKGADQPRSRGTLQIDSGDHVWAHKEKKRKRLFVRKIKKGGNDLTDCQKRKISAPPGHRKTAHQEVKL